MLVLSRQRNEEVVIGDPETVHINLTDADREALRRSMDQELIRIGLVKRLLDAQPGQIVVTTVDIRGDKVRSGFDAPRALEVHRKEVYDAIRRERAAGGYVAGKGGGRHG